MYNHSSVTLCFECALEVIVEIVSPVVRIKAIGLLLTLKFQSGSVYISRHVFNVGYILKFSKHLTPLDCRFFNYHVLFEVITISEPYRVDIRHHSTCRISC